MALIDASNMELTEKVVAINRVSKTVKGGRIMKLSVLVVVGDGNGVVGFGIGKSGEVPDAIRKAIQDAKKNLIRISLKGTTIPHEIIGTVRAVVEAAGIKDIRAKQLRSNNPYNAVRATISGLANIRSAETVAALRGKTVKEITG